jgi:hypothetical protein
MAARTLPGWKREKGTGRGYIGPSGERLSRRQYDKLAATVAPKKPVDATWYARVIRGVRNFWRRLGKYTDKRRAEGASVKRAEARREGEFKAGLKELRALKGRTRKAREMRGRGHHGRAADYEARTRGRLTVALEKLGLRAGIPEWVPPGMSDEYLRGALKRDSAAVVGLPMIRPRGS